MAKEQTNNPAKTRTVISKTSKKKCRPQGSQTFINTEQVVYKTKIGTKNGKPLYHSETRHELVK